MADKAVDIKGAETVQFRGNVVIYCSCNEKIKNVGVNTPVSCFVSDDLIGSFLMAAC